MRKLSREDLESFVLDRLREDPGLGTALLLRFSSVDDDESTRQIIGKLVADSTDNRSGMIEDSYGLSVDLGKLQDQARARSNAGKYLAAFRVHAAIIDEIAPICYEAEDHEGFLIETVDESLGDVLTLAKDGQTDEAALAEIREWSQSNVASGWARQGSEWDALLLEIHLRAARGKTELDESLSLCASFCTAGNSDFHARYLAERSAALMLSAWSRNEDKGARAAFIRSHMGLEAVRDAALGDAIALKDWVQAEAITREGILLATTNKAYGNASKYAHSLIDVLERAGRTGEARVLLESWTVQESSLDWFREIKQRIKDPVEWNDIRERIMRSLPSAGRTFLAVLLAEEGLVGRLHELALKDRNLMGTHYALIGSLYPDAAANHLRSLIRPFLHQPQTRDAYARIASKVSEYGRYAGMTAAAALVEELISLYPNRPAMAQELRKVLKDRAPRAPDQSGLIG